MNAGAGASAALARVQEDAETVKITAAAIGEKSRLEGQGEADRVLAIGTANATATKLGRRVRWSGVPPRRAENSRASPTP